jgi:Serine/threonine protein phosphatase
VSIPSPAPGVGEVRVEVGAATDRGLRREGNEDAYLAEAPVYLVADGMGGYDAGDRASAAVVDAFRDVVAGRADADVGLVADALLAAGDRVARVAANTLRGAGSTVAGAVLVRHEGTPHWLVFNVGDSRVYRFAGGALDQLTVDHSLGQAMVSRGQLRPEDLATFPGRNVITRAIGASDSMADSWLVPVSRGERLLVCSDGLHSEVGHAAIREVLARDGDPEETARELVDLANANGGRDNITVVVVDVGGGGGDYADTLPTGLAR